MKFSEMLKEKRIAQNLTLRSCSSRLGVDPSNWSKIERGVTPAPKDTDILTAWAEILNIKGTERQTFLDLAAISRREIPQDIARDEKVIAALPAFFRAVRGQELEGKRLKEFIEDLREIHSPDKE
jgi:transcriptional regulator with XRE-family HTH domain